MSSIDCVDNVHCVDLVLNKLIVPVYWVQQTLQHDRTGEDVTIKDLMLGGGSGEHDAMHVRNADLLALWVILTKEFEKDRFTKDTDILKIEDLYQQKIESRARSESELLSLKDYPYNFENFICIADWPISSLAKLELEFIEKSKDLNDKYKGLKSCETALLYSIATFTIFNMPKEFFDEDIYNLIQKHKSSLTLNKYTSIFKFESPPNEISMGRTMKDGNVIWGYSLNDYISDRNEKLNSENEPKKMKM